MSHPIPPSQPVQPQQPVQPVVGGEHNDPKYLSAQPAGGSGDFKPMYVPDVYPNADKGSDVAAHFNVRGNYLVVDWEAIGGGAHVSGDGSRYRGKIGPDGMPLQGQVIIDQHTTDPELARIWMLSAPYRERIINLYLYDEQAEQQRLQHEAVHGKQTPQYNVPIDPAETENIHSAYDRLKEMTMQNPYPQQQQGYPQQGYPQQNGYPQQGYPQQPQQQVPQQYPNPQQHQTPQQPAPPPVEQAPPPPEAMLQVINADYAELLRLVDALVGERQQAFVFLRRAMDDDHADWELIKTMFASTDQKLASFNATNEAGINVPHEPVMEA